MALLELLAGSPALFVILTVAARSDDRQLSQRGHLPLTAHDAAGVAGAMRGTARPANPGRHARLSLWGPRSQCPHCHHLIGATENIPLLSYIRQRGRCAHCGVAIGAQYPLVEAASGLLAGIVAWKFGFGWPVLAVLLFTWTLLAASVIDLHHQLLPDDLTLPLLWLGLLAALFGLGTDLRSAVIGAMAGYLSLWLVYQGFRLLTGKEGMGHGDFKLLAALGAWTGWQYLVTIVLLSSLVGAICGLALILLRGRARGAPLPFGPFLAAAGWIALLWGETINPRLSTLAGLLMLVVGLTGGIGSGKTAVSDRFARHGVPVIDTDLIARELVEPGQPALVDIVTEFGSNCLDDRRPTASRAPARAGFRRSRRTTAT
jgi:leader peptidase (prepilin peptidase)/N-methyltransferase